MESQEKVDSVFNGGKGKLRTKEKFFVPGDGDGTLW